jgi:hypothetical protein
MRAMKPAALSRPAFRSLALVAVLAVGISLQAASQQPQQTAASPSPVYNVELVIFRATTGLGAPENWSSATELESSPDSGAPEASGELPPAPAAPAAQAQTARFVQALPETQYQLTNVVAKLRQSGGYAPVAHVAWSQTASPWGTKAGFPVQRLGINVEGLSGTIFLERGQYLHLGMSLSYAIANPPSSLGAEPGTVFTLNDSNRIRFRELSYYDHPAFAVIALVTPSQGARPAGR